MQGLPAIATSLSRHEYLQARSILGNIRVPRILRGGYGDQYLCNPLPEEAVIVSLPKVVGLVFYGLLLSMGLSTFAQAEIFDRRKGGQGVGATQSPRMENARSAVGKTIQSEVLRVEGNDCVIKDPGSKEGRLQIDITTFKTRNIAPGDRIEAKVNERNHVLSFRPGGHGSPK